jgi:hypothetical protein
MVQLELTAPLSNQVLLSGSATWSSSLFFSYWLHHRAPSIGLILITLLMLALCAAVLLLIYEHAQEPHGMDEFYGLLG